VDTRVASSRMLAARTGVGDRARRTGDGVENDRVHDRTSPLRVANDRVHDRTSPLRVANDRVHDRTASDHGTNQRVDERAMRDGVMKVRVDERSAVDGAMAGGVDERIVRDRVKSVGVDHRTASDRVTNDRVGVVPGPETRLCRGVHARYVPIAMSIHLTRWIPVDPTFVPSDTGIARALEWLRTHASDAESVTAESFPAIRFVDCGENFEAIYCPRCGAELSLSWWQAAMDAAAATAFEDRGVTLPCCDATDGLETLRYDSPIKFARFVLEARNASLGAPTAADDEKVADLLGAPVRHIVACY